MTDAPASDGSGSPRERRREQERRRRRARARRRARGRLGALVLVVAAVLAFALTRGPSQPAAPSASRTKISVAVAKAGLLPAALQDAAVAANGRGSLLLLGGITATGTSTAAIVDVTAAGASTIRAQLPDVQHDAQAALLGGEVYVFGGGDLASYPHILRFDPASGAVTSAGELPRPQSDVAVTTIGSTAFIVGGFDGTSPLDTIVAWRPGARPRYVARLPFAVRYAAVAAVGGRLIIAGAPPPAGSATRSGATTPQTAPSSRSVFCRAR